jgi:hypothetical protein
MMRSGYLPDSALAICAGDEWPTLVYDYFRIFSLNHHDGWVYKEKDWPPKGIIEPGDRSFTIVYALYHPSPNAPLFSLWPAV